MIEYFSIYILGVLSILSACTIIVIPVLLSQVLTQRRKLYTALLFSAGFSTSFIVLGVTLSIVGRTILPKYEPYLLLFGAFVTLVMGLRMLNVLEFNIPTIITYHTSSNTLILGMLTGFIGISCISPLLGPVILFSISQKTVVSSAVVMLIYSAGYATPLIAASTLFEEESILAFTRRHRKKIDTTAGLLLILSSIYLILIYLGFNPVI